MKKFIASLASRKFIIAVGTVLTLISQHQFYAAAGVAGAYILAEAHVDASTSTPVPPA